MNPGCLFIFLLVAGICLADKSSSPQNQPDLSGPKAPIAPANAVKDVKPSEPVVPIEIVHSIVEKTNTTSSKEIPLTPSSSSTTLAPTTVAPPPAPTYGVGEWNVTDTNGRVCILLTGDLSLIFVNETNNETITFRVPSNAPSHGKCEKQCIEFELPNNASLHLMFDKNSTADKFYLKAVMGNVSYEVGPANKTVRLIFANDNLHLFENPLEKSYYCNPVTEEIIYTKPLEHLTLKVESFQVQAFKNSSSNTGFDTPVDCQASHTPDIIPIIVGCLLALLVIFVLIAYLISRRQSQSRGYVSM